MKTKIISMTLFCYLILMLGCSTALAQAKAEAEAPPVHLKVAGGSGTITITGSTTATKVSGAEVEQDGDKARISALDKDLNLTVPAGARVTVNSRSGDVKVSGVAGPVTIKAISGSAQVEGATRGLTYRAISGNLNASGIKGPLKVRTVSGKVKVKGALEGCKVRTVSGSVRLEGVRGLDVRSTSGTVVVDGVDLASMSESQKTSWRTRTIGYVFQFYNLLPVLTAWENVELPLLVLPLSKAERREHVQAALDAVGLNDRAEHYPRELSGGQEQRVAIARAIVTDPRILVADEPTGNLDAESEAEIMELLQRLNKEYDKTLMMVTHDAAAAAYAERVIKLEKGKLVSEEDNGREVNERAD